LSDRFIPAFLGTSKVLGTIRYVGKVEGSTLKQFLVSYEAVFRIVRNFP
jgi:hypothetical protein